MTTLTFEEVPNPDFQEYPAMSDELTCEECGKPLTYAGRGRKPRFCEEHKPGRKSSSGSSGNVKRTRPDVDQAISTLDGLYTGVSMALMATSPRGLAKWEAQRPLLIEQDRGILIADKALCRRINDMASAGGTGAFIIAHIMAAFPVAMIVREDVTVRRQTRTAAQREAQAAAEAAAAQSEQYGAGAPYMP